VHEVVASQVEWLQMVDGDLSEGGQARGDAVPDTAPQVGLGDLVARWAPWTDRAYAAAKYIQELVEFVQAPRAKQIVLARRSRRRLSPSL
jgi:hypothetical protein